MKPLLQTLVLMSIALPFVGFAQDLRPCRDISVNWVCEGGQPVLSVEKDAQYRLTMTLADASSPLVNQATTLGATQSNLRISPISRPSSAFTILLLGDTKRPAGCCFGSRIVQPPPPDFCVDIPVPVADASVSLALDPKCPLGAAGNICSGTITFGQTGLADSIIPANLYADFKDVSIRLPGPFRCFEIGADSAFCQIPATLISPPLTLPVTLETPPVYRETRLELCANLAPPMGPIQKTILVQTALNALGFDAGTPDGKSGPMTQAAVRDFAVRYGIRATGPLDISVLNTLGLGAFVDENLSNNLACATTLLEVTPRPNCGRDARFVEGRGCVVIDRAPPLSSPEEPVFCDPDTTILRGGACQCRFERMVSISPSACRCEMGGGLPYGGCP